MPVTLNNTISQLGGAVAQYGGSGMLWQVLFNGAFAVGDKVTLILTDAQTGIQYQYGAGNVTGTSPAFCYTYNDKVHVLAQATDYFSAIDQPEIFDDPNAAGNGFETLSNWFATTEPLVAMAPFQGNLLFAARRTVQIWYEDPNPANNAKQQVLPNIGTVAALSVQPIGDMDVIMLADNGFRSVRPRVASNNALVEDVGTPIDLIIQPLLARIGSGASVSCGSVDPNTNRYFCFIPDSANPNGVGYIYVRSYFPKATVEAWSTYDPSYQVAKSPSATIYPNPPTISYTGLTVGKRYVWTPGANEVQLVCGSTTLVKATTKSPSPSFVATATTATISGAVNGAAYTGLLTVTAYFTPVKFVAYNGQVYALGSDSNLYQLGGPSNVSYENCGMYGTTPYHSMGQPATIKTFESLDAAFQGVWTISFGCDYTTGKFKPVYNNNVSSFQLGNIPVKMSGTHYALGFTEDGNGYALFSSFLIHLQENQQKGQ